MNGLEECDRLAAYLLDLMCWQSRTRNHLETHVTPKPRSSLRAEDLRRGVIIIIIGDRVWSLFGFVTDRLRWRPVPGLSLAQRREWLS